MKNKKKIGIALGGGSVRGLAHIGILKVFDEANIPISYISGTSIGAVIGAAYCSGLNAKEIEKLALSTDFMNLMDFTIPKRGLIAGRKIESLMNKITREKTFEELLIPLSVVATDLEKAQKVVLTKGNVSRAIRASIAIPPFFTPVLIRGHELVDGALVDPVPVSDIMEMGADLTVAIDLSHNIEIKYAKGMNEPKRSGFAHLFYERFVKTEYDLARDIFRQKKIKYLPKFMKNLIVRFFDRFLNPARIMRLLSGREIPDLLFIMLKQINTLINELTKEKLNNSDVDIVIKLEFKNMSIFDFDKAKEIIKEGEEAARRELPKIKKLLS